MRKYFSKQTVLETLILTLANLIVATAINLLAWRFHLVSGGLTGYALVVNFLSDLPIGVILLTTNTILLILAFLLVGKTSGLRGVYGFVSLSFFLDITRVIFHLNQVSAPGYFYELLLIVVLSMIMGTAISFILANNYNVGSYSTIYIIVKKYFNISAQLTFFILDALLAITTLIFFGIEKGSLLVINAILAYYVVKFVLPRLSKFFKDYYSKL